MSNTGGARAWRFLKRNPRYIVEWWMSAAGVPPPRGKPLPIRTQTQEDLKAARWGLLAWEDPLEDDGPASPFWRDAPVLDAIPVPGAPGVGDLDNEPGWRLSGLRLADGPVVLKVERGDAAVQMRIADGAGFDPAGGIEVRWRAVLDLRTRLRRAADLWPIAAAAPKKAGSASPTRSCLLRSTAGWAASPCAA
ncbi:MAG: hypothetical protein OXN81_07840 [Alphaproteobacteria bacterium]|nr:hypothetical protein [Alphaproteobacteria bacterium]